MYDGLGMCLLCCFPLGKTVCEQVPRPSRQSASVSPLVEIKAMYEPTATANFRDFSMLREFKCEPMSDTQK